MMGYYFLISKSRPLTEENAALDVDTNKLMKGKSMRCFKNKFSMNCMYRRDKNGSTLAQFVRDFFSLFII